MHTPYGKAWSAMGKKIDMLSQDTCMFHGDALGVYDHIGGAVMSEEEG
jgi:ribulose-5-phosphate 4-epimerase/fuculose-1-phosphate aldolase